MKKFYFIKNTFWLFKNKTDFFIKISRNIHYILYLLFTSVGSKKLIGNLIQKYLLLYKSQWGNLL